MVDRLAAPLRWLASLRLTLVLSIVVPLMLISGGGIYWGLATVEKNFSERLQEDLELVARAASGPLSRAISDGDQIVLDEALESILRIGRVSGASVFDDEGNQVASLGVADSDVASSRSAAEVIDSGEIGGAFRQVEGEQVFSQFTPLIADDGRIIGLLQVTRKRSDFEEQLATMRFWAVAIWSVLSLVVIIVVVLGHYGSVGRHVTRLMESMSRMRPGHWDIPDDASGPREIRQIQAGVTAMGRRMAEAEAEILNRMERERALAEQLEYQEKVAMIGRVAGGVAHELGAPLSVIEGRARILARGMEDDRQTRHLDDIRYQVERMTRIIQQLLDCFRHVPDSRRAIDLAAGLQKVMQQLESDPRGQGKEVALHGTEVAAWIEAEPTRLELACLNVIRNACQAAHQQVTVTLEPRPGCWAVVVDDDGPGVPDTLRERIFEPFYSTKPAGEGTGLGLAVVGSVIKEHQGSLEVTASPAGGCRMILCWPEATAPDRGERYD